MWPKNQTTLTKVGVFFLLIYALIIQRPYTGLSFELFEHAPQINSDLTSAEIFNKYNKGKMKLAEEKPLPKVASLAILKPNSEPSIENNHEGIKEIIKSAAREYNIDSEMMIAIAECESGLREKAVNGQYAGLFQFHPQTWQSNRRAMGLDDETSLRFDAQEAAKTAAFKMSRDGVNAWPECGQRALLATIE